MSIPVNSWVKLLLGTVVILVATICVTFEFGDFLGAPDFFNWERLESVIMKNENHGMNILLESRHLKELPTNPYQNDSQGKSTEHGQQANTTESLQKMEHHHFLEPTETKQLPIPPIPGPPPNLPWMQKGLKVTPYTLMSLAWVKELWYFLNTKVDSSLPVVITASNYEYRSSLLNWLVHALVQLEVKNVLVLSMDKEMHDLLQAKDISSLYVPHHDLSQVRGNSWNTGLLHVEIARLVVMRLLNRWGYDVLNYDNDAFILRNPQELFDLYPNSHVIGSESFMPKKLHAKWGVTLCMGTILMRASPESGTTNL